LGLIFISLLVMDLLMIGVLAIRTEMLVKELLGEAADKSQAYQDELVRAVRAQGATWSLHGATLAIFLRAAVIASTALLLSTISTSTLFTTITTFVVYFIGSFQSDAREVYLMGGDAGISPAARLAALVVAAIFPDFGLFNVVDRVIEGKLLELSHLGGLVGIAAFYVVLHSFVSWLVFAGKEF
jgi:hypothetical protein